MNKIYFNNPENVKKLGDELEEWLGTPYRHFCKAKGRGVDCALFLASVFVNLRIIKKLDYEYYSKDWHNNSLKNIFLINFEYNIHKNIINGLKVDRVETAINPLLQGDWLMFCTNSKHINHSAVYIGDGKIVHAIQNRGVIIDELKTWKHCMKRSYRLYHV